MPKVHQHTATPAGTQESLIPTIVNKPDAFNRLNTILQRLGHAPVNFQVTSSTKYQAIPELDPRTQKLLSASTFANALATSRRKVHKEARSAKEAAAATLAECLELALAIEQQQRHMKEATSVPKQQDQEQSSMASNSKQLQQQQQQQQQQRRQVNMASGSQKQREPRQSNVSRAPPRHYQLHQAPAVRRTQQARQSEQQGTNQINDNRAGKVQKKRSWMDACDHSSEAESPSKRVRRHL